MAHCLIWLTEGLVVVGSEEKEGLYTPNGLIAFSGCLFPSLIQ